VFCSDFRNSVLKGKTFTSFKYRLDSGMPMPVGSTLADAFVLLILPVAFSEAFQLKRLVSCYLDYPFDKLLVLSVYLLCHLLLGEEVQGLSGQQLFLGFNSFDASAIHARQRIQELDWALLQETARFV
jgi:hypothetical protein